MKNPHPAYAFFLLAKPLRYAKIKANLVKENIEARLFPIYELPKGDEQLKALAVLQLFLTAPEIREGSND